jgi:hypothetical protein
MRRCAYCLTPTTSGRRRSCGTCCGNRQTQCMCCSDFAPPAGLMSTEMGAAAAVAGPGRLGECALRVEVQCVCVCVCVCVRACVRARARVRVRVRVCGGWMSSSIHTQVLGTRAGPCSLAPALRVRGGRLLYVRVWWPQQRG